MLKEHFRPTTSVTILDDFWKVSATDFLTKVAKLSGDFWTTPDKHLATYYFHIWSHCSSETTQISK